MPNYKGNEATLTKYKPKWKSGNTRTIRVPVALADQILAYAHKLDEGKVIWSDRNSVGRLLQVIDWLKDVQETQRNNFSRQKKDLVGKAIQEIETLIQVN